MPSRLFRLARLVCSALLIALWLAGVGRAEEASPPAPQPSAPASQPSASPAQPPPSGAQPAPADASPAPPETKQGEASTGQIVDLPARPFAYVEGKAGRDDIYSAILASLAVVRRDIDKAGMKPVDHPLAVFVGSDDSGFQYHAGYPLEAAPQGDAALPDAVRIGQTPSGKAMRFQHLGAYADIDATYDAITAYLDEKGIDAQDLFVEEYVNDVKDPDDPALQVNIYVLLK